MLENHHIEIWDSSHECYRMYNEHDFEIDGLTLEEHNKKIKEQTVREFLSLLEEQSFYCPVNRYTDKEFDALDMEDVKELANKFLEKE